MGINACKIKKAKNNVSSYHQEHLRQYPKQDHPWMVASAGETNRDLAWTQLAQKLSVYNIL
jgi:hypothetical protein